jgi:general secretion pathway protein L
MNSWLYLGVKSIHHPGEPWAVQHWTNDASPSRCSLAEAGTALQGRAVQVILPMEICSWLRSAPWPGRRKPHALALAYAVEEQLSEDLDDLHLAVGSPDLERRFPLLVIRKSTLRIVLDSLRAAGIHVTGVWADADRLPSDRPCGVWVDGRWLLGGAIEARLALSDQALSVLRHRLPVDTCWRDERLPAQPPGIPMLSAANTRSINLLQGDFRLSSSTWRWRYGVLALVCVFALSWGASVSRAQYLEALAGKLYEQSLQRFRSLYPEQTRIVDLQAQLKALQAGASEKQGPMTSLLKVVAQVIAASGAQVRRIEFNATEGWKMAITAGSFNELERLRERGAQSGLPLRLDSASKSRDGVNAMLIIEAPGK